MAFYPPASPAHKPLNSDLPTCTKRLWEEWDPRRNSSISTAKKIDKQRKHSITTLPILPSGYENVCIKSTSPEPWHFESKQPYCFFRRSTKVLLPAVNSEPPTGHVPRATICFLDPGWSWNICPVSHHLCMDIHLYVCTASIYIYTIYIYNKYIYIYIYLHVWVFCCRDDICWKSHGCIAQPAR